MRIPDPVRPAFRVGEADRGGPHAVSPLLTLLALAGVGCVLLAGAMLGGAATDARLAEPHVPAGSWSFEWAGGVEPPVAEQTEQLRALREVAAGAAGLIALLSLMIAVGLWRQRLRLRRAEDRVHWAVGARRLQLAARLMGEAWRWGALALALAVVVAYGLPFGIERTFPGSAEVPPGLAGALIAMTAAAAVLLRWESRAGGRAARVDVRSRAIVSSPTAVAAVGFAVLTGVGLLSRHAPGAAPTEGDERRLVAGLSLDAIPADLRGRAVAEWVERASGPTVAAPSGTPAMAAGRKLGVASAGAVRGTGHRALVWVDCGDCYEGGFPLPIRRVAAEVHAVAADTFPHLGLRLLQGRDFDDRADRRGPGVAIVSRSLAARHFEDGAPIGRRIRIGDTDWITVVGVVSDAPDVRDHSEYAVYLPVTRAAPTEIEVFGETSPEAVGAWIDAAPEGAVSTTLRTSAQVFAVHGWFARLMSLLGILAYALVVAGVWLGSRNEARATAFELSLRRAVGASRSDVRALFLGTSGRRLAIATGLGAWLSLFLGAGLNRAYGTIPQIDWMVWLRVGALVGVAYLVGAWPSFARAARLPPGTGLKTRS